MSKISTNEQYDPFELSEKLSQRNDTPKVSSLMKPETKITEKNFISAPQREYCNSVYQEIRKADSNLGYQSYYYDFCVTNFAFYNKNGDSTFNKYIAWKIASVFIYEGGNFSKLHEGFHVPFRFSVVNENYQEIWINIHKSKEELVSFLNDLKKITKENNDISEKLIQLLQYKDGLNKNSVTYGWKVWFIYDMIELLNCIKMRVATMKSAKQPLEKMQLGIINFFVSKECLEVNKSVFLAESIDSLTINECQRKGISIDLPEYDNRTGMVLTCEKNPAITVESKFPEKVENSFKK